MCESKITSALKQINKLQAELIQTEQLIKDALLDYIPNNFESLLKTLIGSSIPNLLLEIGHIFKTANFDFKVEKVIPEEYFPIDIKEEIFIGDVEEEEDFIIVPDQSQGFEDPEAADEPQHEAKSITNKFIIEGTTGDERSKSLETFVSICLQLSGTKAALMKHMSTEKGFICPHCLPPFKLQNCYKASSFLRHIVRVHESSHLIPLPFVKKIVKNTVSRSQREAKKAAAASIQTLSQNSEGAYLLNGDNFQEKHRRLSLFVSLCLKSPGVSDRVLEYKQPNGSFNCPHCPPERSGMMSLAQPSKFMIHLVRNHEDSELIPFLFIRPKEGEGVKGKEQSTVEESANEKTPFLICDRSTFDQFLTRCLNFPGVRDNLTRTFYKEGEDGKKGFACPHCHPNRRLTLCKIRDFMRHLVPVHPKSELIPLPFVREGSLTKKRKLTESAESSFSSVGEKKTENNSHSSSMESEFILGLD